jgi:hypothetical protein
VRLLETLTISFIFVNMIYFLLLTENPNKLVNLLLFLDLSFVFLKQLKNIGTMAQKKLGSMLLVMTIIYVPLSLNLLLLLKIMRLSLTFKFSSTEPIWRLNYRGRKYALKHIH